MNQPGQASITPLTFSGFPMTGSHLGEVFGGLVSQSTNPASDSSNGNFLAINGRALETKVQNMQSTASGHDGRIAKLKLL